VLYGADASAIAGEWSLVADDTAAGGRRMSQPDRGAPKLTTPQASPANYFEFTFNAVSWRPYRLWLRGKAQNNHYANDSVYVQFSGSIDDAGGPIYRIGSTSATTVVIEDCSGCGLSGWGWQDNAYGTGALGPTIQFSHDGPQRIRIQTREDGLSIDQVILSSETYLSRRPGAAKNDTTIVPKPPPPGG
jgi:hypothetical protein